MTGKLGVGGGNFGAGPAKFAPSKGCFGLGRGKVGRGKANLALGGDFGSGGFGGGGGFARAAGVAGGEVVVNVLGVGAATAGGFVGVVVVGEVGGVNLVANDVEGVVGFGREQVEAVEEFLELGAGGAVFEDFGGVNEAGEEFGMAGEVAGGFLVERDGFVAEHHGDVAGIAADEEVEDGFNAIEVAEDVGDVLVGDGDGDAIVAAHNFVLWLCVNGRHHFFHRAAVFCALHSITKFFAIGQRHVPAKRGGHVFSLLILIFTGCVSAGLWPR